MSEMLLYGLDEAGEPTFTERLPAMDRAAAWEVARERLRACHGVEVWHGPMCILRIHRQAKVAD